MVFFHTGDVGRWNDNGTLSIIDRKKNIFKLAQGEYVAAEYLEGVFTKSRFVQQIFVYGDSYQSCLVAVVVPDFEVLKNYAKENGFEKADDIAALCVDEKIKKTIMADITETGKDSKLHGFEFVKAIHVEPEPFSVESGLMTPSLKPVRAKLQAKYQSIIVTLYKSVESTQK